MVLGDVAQDSTTKAGSEDAKGLRCLKRYVVAFTLFRCFDHPFTLG